LNNSNNNTKKENVISDNNKATTKTEYNKIIEQKDYKISTSKNKQNENPKSAGGNCIVF